MLQFRRKLSGERTGGEFLTVMDGGDEFDCECGLCSHVLKVLDFIRMNQIHVKHILKRRTKDARDVLAHHLCHYQKNLHNNPFSYRHFNLYMQAMELFWLGDTSMDAYERLMVWVWET
ncbi:hypothetical protein VPH35_117035 [Triticum aestivum]|uniref:Uncharacterized protein n=1 Tax=Aegilops tauschii subsp. strangulata TaxID=200361 RepID=A0A453NY89_AEGTS